MNVNFIVTLKLFPLGLVPLLARNFGDATDCRNVKDLLLEDCERNFLTVTGNLQKIQFTWRIGDSFWLSSNKIL